MKISKEAQCEKNVRNWLTVHNIPALHFLAAESDRCWFERTTDMEFAVRVLALKGVLTESDASLHGPSVVIGYRENYSRGSAQVVIHTEAIEVDFDYWNPQDVVGWIGHGWEVLMNKIGRKKTDPFKIAKLLKKRNIDDPVSV